MVAVEVWEVGAGDIKTEALPGLEEHSYRVELNCVLVRFTRVDQRRVIVAVAVLRPLYAVGEVHRYAVFVDDDQLGCEVCVDGVGRGPELYGDGADEA